MALNLGKLTSNRRIPTILGLLVLIGGVIAGVILVGQRQGFSLRAGPTSTPRQVRITNINDTSFTVSWITDTSVSGFVRFGTGAGDLDSTFGDDRDQISGQTGLYTTHQVTVKDLRANTDYFFKIGAGSQLYDNDGDAWEVTTAPTVARPAADPISGKVLLASGQPASGVLVYIEVEGGSPISTQTKASGVWNLSLSQMRVTTLESFLTYDKETVRISIFAQGGDLGSATAIVTGANKNPVPDITLGETLDFQTDITAASPVITIVNNSFNPAELTVTAGQTVLVVNNDTASHSARARNNEFTTGVIAPGGQSQFTAPETPGSYTFFDDTHPELESLVGTLTVIERLTVVEVTPTPTIVAEITPVPTLSPAIEATYSVKIVSPDINSGLVASDSPQIKVQGPVGTTVKITVRSDPQTNTSTIGADGEIEWTPPDDLEPGLHTVEIQYVDGAGVTQTYTKTFTVLAAATTTSTPTTTPVFSASPSATLTLTPTATASPTIRSSMPSTASGIPEAGVLTPTLVLLTLGIGLFLAGIGWQIKWKSANLV